MDGNGREWTDDWMNGWMECREWSAWMDGWVGGWMDGTDGMSGHGWEWMGMDGLKPSPSPNSPFPPGRT